MLKYSGKTNLFYILGSLLLLQGCANTPERSSSDSQSATLASGRQAAKLDDLSEGDTLVFDGGLLSSLGTLTVGREYEAASGRMCKQILSAPGGQQMSVACKSEDQWYVRQALNGVSGHGAVADESEMSPEVVADKNRVWDSNKLNKPKMVSAPTIVLSERSVDASSGQAKDKPSTKSADKKIKQAAAMSSEKSSKTSSDKNASYRLEENETLWSFSKRTTGNALNWQAIAKYNDIDNEQELKIGMPLRVPQALNRAE